MKQKAIICDIDGTIAMFKGNGPNGEDLRKPFYVEDDECHHYSVDKVNEVVLEIVQRFASTHYIIFCSGRTDNNRQVTQDWLDTHTDLPTYSLYMRAKGDFRRDDVVKEEIYRTYIEPFCDILFCIDDRNQIVEMWRRIGLICLQVAEGNF